MGIIRKCNNHSFEERARAVWKEECRRPRPSVEMQCTKDGPCSYLPSAPPLSAAVHRRMDRNFVRPHVMFEIMNVRSSGERSQKLQVAMR